MEAVEALLFDVFGTVVDWRSSVEQELCVLKHRFSLDPTDWEREFAQEWRNGYMETTRNVAAGASGASNVDKMHREILDRMLDAPNSRWGTVGRVLDEAERQSLNNVWHRWPDSTEGLHALKKQIIISTLSNGNVRLLVDMAKHADLPWDMVFSTELFNTYKPLVLIPITFYDHLSLPFRNPKAYLGAAHHLSLPPEKCAMVAAHIGDLRAAAAVGMKTIYIPRPGEDNKDVANAVKSKHDGGEVDIVASSLVELSSILSGLRNQL
ncbi:hypothetical protein Hypma_013847 [Hypsizygus marmoreus]|uniref:Haloacid dehalogenase n=1 Tax=Hypsizygus marmoreus TaxID=39966 RepID=A0A369K5W8_HYPMA|nr:hypothetical protein Hypma_013847 [Hypsizygus marmoreus]